MMTIQDEIDLAELRAFLQENKLPFEDIKLEGALYFGYRDENKLFIGSGGLELFGDHALLRSLAVTERERGKNLGKKIVDDLLLKAKSLGAHHIFVLTETARDFFIKKGFQDIERSNVPESVRNATQFTSTCSSSASCMTYTFANLN